MATKAISTVLSDVVIFIVRLFVFIMFGNPLSMWVLNFFAPRKAAEFSKNKAIFGDKIYAFYEKRALKWPFFWACHWMKLEECGLYSTKRQIKYFFKVAVKNKTEAETLKAFQNGKFGKIFWPDAFEELFFKYGNKDLPYEERRSYMNGDCMVCYVKNVTIAEFMMRNVRLSYVALQNVIEKATISEDMRKELGKYLSTGKLNDAQFELLIDAVTTSPGSGDLQMLGLLLDYVKRYNISEKHMEKCRQQYPKVFMGLVEDAKLENKKKSAKSHKTKK